jgi:hypothetical protein
VQPDEKNDEFELPLEAGTYGVEWHSVATRETKSAGAVNVAKSTKVRFTSLFPSAPAVLYLKAR